MFQKLEVESPRQRLAQGGDVHLTDEEIRHLRQEIAEQESLLRGYQIENERATESLREVQRQAKERERMLTEQNTALASQLASLQASGGLKLSNEETYASLRESLTLRAEILSAQAREAAVISEIEKMKEAKKVLENKVADFEKVTKVKTVLTINTSDVSCQCTLLSKNYSDDSVSANCELKEESRDTECHEVQSPENHEEKENFVQNSQFKMDQKEEIKAQNLQKRMERMKKEYDLKIRNLKQQLEKKPVASQDKERAGMRRVKELEAQISEIRSFYTKKLKEQAEKSGTNILKKSEGKVAKAASKSARLATSLVQGLDLSRKRVAVLEESLEEKEAIIRHLEENLLGVVQERGAKGGCCTVNTISNKSSNDYTLEDETSPSFLSRGVGNGEVPLSVVYDKPDASFKSQKGTAVSIGPSKRESPFLKINSDDSFLTRMDMEPQNKHSSDDVKDCRQEAVDNLEDLVQGAAMPSLAQSQQLQALQEKVVEMEARQKHRELEWQGLLIETKRLLNEERDMAGRKWQFAMEAKNSEIKRFKLELDSILETAIQMQRAQLNKA